MQRYKLYPYKSTPGHKTWNKATCIEDPEGEWVKWEDHETVIEKIDKIYARWILELEEKVEQWKKELKNVEAKVLKRELKAAPWVTWFETTHSGNEIYVCPMCKGRKQIDKTEHGLMAVGDKYHFCDCTLCKGKGYIIPEESP